MGKILLVPYVRKQILRYVIFADNLYSRVSKQKRSECLHPMT